MKAPRFRFLLLPSIEDRRGELAWGRLGVYRAEPLWTEMSKGYPVRAALPVSGVVKGPSWISKELIGGNIRGIDVGWPPIAWLIPEVPLYVGM